MKEEKFGNDIRRAFEQRATEIDPDAKERVWDNLNINRSRIPSFLYAALLALSILALAFYWFDSRKETSNAGPILDHEFMKRNIALVKENQEINARLNIAQIQLQAALMKLEDEKNKTAAEPEVRTKIEYLENIIRDTITIEKQVSPEIIQVFIRDTIYLSPKINTEEPAIQARAEMVQFNFNNGNSSDNEKIDNRKKTLKVKVYNR